MPRQKKFEKVQLRISKWGINERNIIRFEAFLVSKGVWEVVIMAAIKESEYPIVLEPAGSMTSTSDTHIGRVDRLSVYLLIIKIKFKK